MNPTRHRVADRRAGAALETALLLPLILLLGLGTVDLITAIKTWHTLDQVTTQLSEIVSRCDEIDDPQDIDAFMADGQEIANPTDITGGTQGALIVSAIGKDDSGNTVVLWQKQKGSAAFESAIGTAGSNAQTGAYVLPEGDTLVGVEAFSRPTLWLFSGAWMGTLQPTIYSQSMFVFRTTDTTKVVTLQTTSSSSGACTAS